MGYKKKTARAVEQTPPSADPAVGNRPERGFFLSEAVRLNVLVFSAGAVLMGLEIAGSRVLAPHFGNSVFVWGSLISIFLVAISAGNYLGGRVADKYPARIVLNSICILVSLWILGMAIVAHSVCQWMVQSGLGEQTGPLAASVALFLLPSVGMGMVSPFAIRLATLSLHSVGKISGALYALSTLGSIAGTILTTFVFIPLVGVAAILKGLGIILLLAASITLPARRGKASLLDLAAVFLVAGALLACPESDWNPRQLGEKVIVDVESPYQHISVVDNELYHSRQLRFDRYVESAILIAPPHQALTDYTNYFHLALLANPTIQRTLFIGAGGAVGPRAFHSHNPEMAIDVVDIDRKVLDIARSYFFLEDDPHIKTYARDGRMFMRECDGQYDCVILDAFTIGGRIPFHLVTRQFFELCSGKMTTDGVFVININSAVEGPLSGIFQFTYRTLKAVFPNVYTFAKDFRIVGRTASANIILVATKSAEPISPEAWMARAERHQSNSYVTSDILERAVDNLVPDVPDGSARGGLFTDDYAPIETMPF